MTMRYLFHCRTLNQKCLGTMLQTKLWLPVDFPVLSGRIRNWVTVGPGGSLSSSGVDTQGQGCTINEKRVRKRDWQDTFSPMVYGAGLRSSSLCFLSYKLNLYIFRRQGVKQCLFRPASFDVESRSTLLSILMNVCLAFLNTQEPYSWLLLLQSSSRGLNMTHQRSFYIFVSQCLALPSCCFLEYLMKINLISN